MCNPLISVIVTSYNYRQYIGVTLDSLLSQTYSRFEILVVDDGSKDGSVELIRSYTERDKRIRLLTHPGGENRGLIQSVRLGLSRAAGDYVAFCESDDYWSVDHLDKLVYCINRYGNAVLISNGIRCFGEESSVKVRQAYADYVAKTLKYGPNKINLRKHQTRQMIPTFSCVAIRRDVLESLNFDSPVAAWIDFWLYRQIESEYPLHYINKELTFWRQHDSYNGEQSQGDFDEKMSLFLAASNKLIGIPNEEKQ